MVYVRLADSIKDTICVWEGNSPMYWEIITTYVMYYVHIYQCCFVSLKIEMIYSHCTTLDMDVCFCTALAKVNCKLIEQMKDFNYKKQYSFLLPIHIERESVVMVTFPGYISGVCSSKNYFYKKIYKNI